MSEITTMLDNIATENEEENGTKWEGISCAISPTNKQYAEIPRIYAELKKIANNDKQKMRKYAYALLILGFRATQKQKQ